MTILDARREGGEPPEHDVSIVLDRARARRRRRRIRCPHCGWEPDGRPRWQCELCFAVFDTFETRASCPECPNRWRETQCPKCGEVADHEDWYVDEDSE